MELGDGLNIIFGDSGKTRILDLIKRQSHGAPRPEHKARTADQPARPVGATLTAGGLALLDSLPASVHATRTAVPDVADDFQIDLAGTPPQPYPSRLFPTAPPRGFPKGLIPACCFPRFPSPEILTGGRFFATDRTGVSRFRLTIRPFVFLVS